jgi:hypothetical protein
MPRSQRQAARLVARSCTGQPRVGGRFAGHRRCENVRSVDVSETEGRFARLIWDLRNTVVETARASMRYECCDMASLHE